MNEQVERTDPSDPLSAKQFVGLEGTRKSRREEGIKPLDMAATAPSIIEYVKRCHD